MATKQPISSAILLRSLLQTVHQVNKVDPGKAASTRWLITGGFALSRLIERQTKDVDINAQGALAPAVSGRSSDLSEYLIMQPGFEPRRKRRTKEGRKAVPHRGWCVMVKDGEEHIKVPYDYTCSPDDVSCRVRYPSYERTDASQLEFHPRSRILSMITDDDLPFANRDDMIFIKARSCLQRSDKEKRRKDARDFTQLVRELPGPLLFEGHTEKMTTLMRGTVIKHLDDIARWGGMSKGESEDTFEL